VLLEERFHADPTSNVHTSDFVLEPVRGFQRSVQEMDATHLVDGVARGTLVRSDSSIG
jgi:hypothetical protein